ncbi:MAG TPA: proton-conducting transporter membrane subunit [Spirochaetia bacterium]|nr:proton-conducting transporter membrane subunit [Spirochaetia bacterium]
MMWPSFVWLIALPIVTSPVVYLVGRLLQRALEGPAATGGIPAFGPFALEMAKAAPAHSGSAPRRWAANPVRWIGLVVLAASFIPLVQAWGELAQGRAAVFTYGVISLRFDGISLLLAAAVLTLGALVSLFSGAYIGADANQEKYHALLNIMVGAMIGLGCAGDLFNLWIWFETMAVASYMLVAYYVKQPSSLEAGVKYLVQSSAGSMLALLGIGVVFAQTGTLDLPALRGIVMGGAANRLPFLAAGALFSVGFGVKIALVPMHTWLPDAHSQAPSGISAMLSGVVIEAGLIALLRALSVISGASMAWGPLLLAFGAINMIVGNLLALRQTQVKRMLAFSSLAHVGYMLLGIGAAVAFREAQGAQGGLFHLITHSLMKGLAFLAAGGLLFALRISRGGTEPLIVDDLAGAARRYPLTALTFSIALLGLGGLPPMAGFMSKWQIFAAGFQTGNTLIFALVVFALLNSLLSFAYYAPLVNIMYRRAPSPLVLAGGRVPPSMVIVFVILTLAILALGVWPALANVVTVPAGQAVLSIFGAGGGA